MKIKVASSILIGIASLTFLAASCKAMWGGDSDSGSASSAKTGVRTDINAAAFLHVSLDGVTAKAASTSARTALPDFATATGEDGSYDYAGFSKFVLTGAVSGASSEDTIRTWETSYADGGTTVTKTAYAAFCETGASTVPIALSSGSSETWSFTLTGYYGSDLSATDSYITFTNTISVTVKPTVSGYTACEDLTAFADGTTYYTYGNGVYTAVADSAAFDSSILYYTYDETDVSTNLLSFTLSRSSAFVYPYADSGTGAIQITLSYASGSEIAGYTTTAVLYAADGETVSDYTLTTDAEAPATTRVYRASDVKEGKYVAVFSFTENDVAVGSITEYVYVLTDLTSTSEITVNLNGGFAITYRYWILDESEQQDVVVTTASQADDGSYTFATATANSASSNADLLTLFSASASPVQTFSRLATVTLPVASDFADAFNSAETDSTSTYLFCGWYDISSVSSINGETSDTDTIEAVVTSGSPVTEITKNTYVSDRVLIAKFVKRVELPTVSAVTVTPEDATYKVGYTLTATPQYTDDSDTATDFTGTVVWQWSQADAEDAPFANIESESASASVSATTGNAATASTTTYTVQPAYAGCYLKATATQKYTITLAIDSDGYSLGYYTVATNTTAVTSEATSRIANGTLTIASDSNGNAFKLYYGGSSASSAVVIGTALEASSLCKASGIITDAHTTSWSYDAASDNTATVSTFALAFTDETDETRVYAPTASGYVLVTVSVTGYDDLKLGSSYSADPLSGAFVWVTYAAPVKADVLGALWAADSDTTADELEGFDAGYISFKNATMSHTYANVTSEVSDISYAWSTGTSDDATWYLSSDSTNIRETLGGLSLSSAVTTDLRASGSYYFKACAVSGTADEKANPVGYIGASAVSESLTFSEESDTAYIGTRQLVDSITITQVDSTAVSDTTTAVAVGHTFTVQAYDPYGNAISRYAAENSAGLNAVNWTLTSARSESDVTLASDATASYTMRQSDYTACTADTKTVTVAASISYTDGSSTVSSKTLSVTVNKGSMAGSRALNGDDSNDSTLAITYSGPALTAGAKVTDCYSGQELDFDSYLSATGTVLDATDTSAVVVGASGDSTSYSYTIAFATDAVVGSTGTIPVVISAPGYEDYAATDFVVSNVALRPAVPSVALSTSVDSITYGYVQFATDASGYITDAAETDTSAIPWYELEFTRIDYETLNDAYSAWAVISSDSSHAEAKATALATYKALFTSSTDTSWHDVTTAEFVKPTEKLSVRLKKVATAGNSTYYYSSEQAAWYAYDSGSAVEFTGAESDLTVTNDVSDAANVSYSTANNGVRGITVPTITFSKVDAALTATKASGVVTITAGDSTSFTITGWRIDGKSIAKFNAGSDVLCGTPVTEDSSALTLTTTLLRDGSYQITAIGTLTVDGVTMRGYSAGLTVTVSN